MSESTIGQCTHVEFTAHDPAALITFFQTMFGWDIQPFGGEMQYWMGAIGDSGETIGVSGTSAEAPAQSSVGYFEVAAIRPAVEKARSLGAKVILDYYEIPNDHGVIALIQLPGGGSPIGLWAKA